MVFLLIAIVCGAPLLRMRKRMYLSPTLAPASGCAAPSWCAYPPHACPTHSLSARSPCEGPGLGDRLACNVQPPARRSFEKGASLSPPTPSLGSTPISFRSGRDSPCGMLRRAALSIGGLSYTHPYIFRQRFRRRYDPPSPNKYTVGLRTLPGSRGAGIHFFRILCCRDRCGHLRDGQRGSCPAGAPSLASMDLPHPSTAPHRAAVMSIREVGRARVWRLCQAVPLQGFLRAQETSNRHKLAGRQR